VSLAKAEGRRDDGGSRGGGLGRPWTWRAPTRRRARGAAAAAAADGLKLILLAHPSLGLGWSALTRYYGLGLVFLYYFLCGKLFGNSLTTRFSTDIHPYILPLSRKTDNYKI